MASYRAPLRDIRFVLHEVLAVSEAFAEIPRPQAADAEMIDQIGEAAAVFAEEELAPLNASGDLEGCRLTPEGVRAPAGFAEAYQQFVESGWPTLACDEEHGGQGLPFVVNVSVMEMFHGANLSWMTFSIGALGVYKVLSRFGSEELQERYLPKVVSGEWATTMCLTEPHCGSDLGLMRSRAVPADDGSYRLNGSKIFITAGDHDFTDNIVHLVLARLPDAPAGSRGISLFLVPKVLPNGERNGVVATALEEKMGMHGSATCALSFEDAVGYLIGEPNQGLKCMFVMMNEARITTAIQSLGVAQHSFGSALAYAHERQQMRAPGGARRPDLPADPIIVHPDVRRMLLIQKSYVEGSRLLAYWLALQQDLEVRHPDQSVRERAAEFLALLTPVVKAFVTENAFLVTNHTIQIYGGHGYIRESGVEQHARDVRIAQIYEGTTGIQARDLLERKILGDEGEKLRLLLAEIRGFTAAGEGVPAVMAALRRGCDEVEQATRTVIDRAAREPELPGSIGYDYLRMLGHLVTGYLFAGAASIARQRIEDGDTDSFYRSKLDTARFYFARLYPELWHHAAIVREGGDELPELSEEQISA